MFCQFFASLDGIELLVKRFLSAGKAIAAGLIRFVIIVAFMIVVTGILKSGPTLDVHSYPEGVDLDFFSFTVIRNGLLFVFCID